MPTTYAHDLFGRKVYRELPDEIKRVIRKNGSLYRIGLHGPDILFYFMVSKNPVSRFGINMHKEKARAFFEQGVKQVQCTEDEELFAYLLGFGCHYILDSCCHPYVNEMAKKNIVSHTVLEKEFDRTLMIKTGKDPLHYYPSCAVFPSRHNADVIHRALPLISKNNIYISLKMMKMLTNLMVCDDHGRRRKWIGRLLKTGGKSARGLVEHFMTEYPAPEAEEPVKEMEKLFTPAVKEAVFYLQELYFSVKQGCPLSSRWDRTYNG